MAISKSELGYGHTVGIDRGMTTDTNYNFGLMPGTLFKPSSRSIKARAFKSDFSVALPFVAQSAL